MRPPPAPSAEVLAQSQVGAVLDELERDLVGLAPVKQRIRDIAALLVIDKLRVNLGLQRAVRRRLHMCFTGNPGTGKTTVALRMAQILHRLGYVRKGHLVAVTRDDLVGQYIGHTAPKTREVLKKAMGGVLFIDEAYYLYRPENERDYGQEAIEILLQVMENQRDDLVVILAGYKDRMDTFFQSNPGMSSRIAHHLDFPDYTPPTSCCAIAELHARRSSTTASTPARATRSRTTSRCASRSRTSPMRAACATRSTARGCARPAGCSPTRDARCSTRDDLEHASPPPTSAPAACSAATPSHRRPQAARPLGHDHASRTHDPVEVPDPAARRRRGRDATSARCWSTSPPPVKAIAAMAAQGALGGYLGEAGSGNVQGEAQKKLDVLANEVDARAAANGAGCVAGMASEELDEPYAIPREYPRGRYLLVFDPLDGSSNIDVNVSVGTIFSILRHDAAGAPTRRADFLQPGSEQVAAGYAIYGPATMLVLTRRQRHARLHARPRDRQLHPHPSGPDDPGGDQRVRDQHQQRALLGAAGAALRRPNARPGQPASARRDFNMRWIASHGGRGAPHPDARRRVHVPARHHRIPPSRAACACCTRPTRSAC